MIVGGIWQSICFFIYAAVGDRALYHKNGTSNHRAGAVMIVFSCLFIFSFSQTWAPAAYVIVGESYPVRYRSKCAAVATSANWFWNFLISFFTPFITNSIGFKYGYIFASCNLTGAAIIFLFVHETKGRTLEEINTMYASNLKPWMPHPEGYREFGREQNNATLKSHIGLNGETTELIENTDNQGDSGSFQTSTPDDSRPEQNQASATYIRPDKREPRL